MRFKSVVLTLILAVIAVSFGYGLGRGLKPQTQAIDMSLNSTAHAISADSKLELANIFVQIGRKIIPSVVNIFTTATMRPPMGGGPGGPDDMWRRFFEEFFGEPYGGNGPQGGPAPKAQSLGSGFIIEATNTGGLILTNNHVVEGADEIHVKFTEEADEKVTAAEVVGRDPELDLALLKVKTRRKLQPVVLSDSDKLEVGEWIAAIGNPFGHGHSVSHGIVSARERTLPGSYAKYLQVDAPINPGNSGGPLVNLSGEVVGINNAIDARGPGIGFAIPINLAKNVLPQLKTKGRVERGYIGISVDDLKPDLAKSLKLDESLSAPIITHVIPGQPADKAGLKAYDVVREVGGKTVRNSNELVGAITAIPVGDATTLKVVRSGKEKEFKVNVTKRPDFREKTRPKPRPEKVQPKGKRIETGMVLEQVDPASARELGLPENYEGIVVAQVAPGSPAFNAGLTRGDVILEVDRKPVKTVEQFYGIVRAKKTYLMRVRKQDETGRETFAVVALKLAATDE